MRRLLILLISAYRFLISPWLGQNCRFYPSCSCYAQQALRTHGVAKGSWLSVRRIARCNPWHPGGYDPVPLARSCASHPDSDGNRSHG